MRTALIAVILFATVPATAQSLRQSLDPPPPGGIVVETGGRLVMSSLICASLGVDPGVPGAEYREGVDVNGRRVAPADLPDSRPAIALDNFPIEIRKDLAGKFNVPATGGAYGAKAVLGYVTLRDKRAYFNGQPMAEDQRAALAEACVAGKR